MADILAQFGLDWKLMVTVSIGFLLLFIIMSKMAWPAVTKMLEERTTTIKSRLDDAELKRAEMERMRDEYEQRITNIEAEARERIQVAVREAHVARDDLLAQARAQAEQMLERARLEVGHEKEKAMQEIRDLVADLATGAAARILNKELDAQSHRQLIDDVIDSVAKNGGSR